MGGLSTASTTAPASVQASRPSFAVPRVSKKMPSSGRLLPPKSIRAPGIGPMGVLSMINGGHSVTTPGASGNSHLRQRPVRCSLCGANHRTEGHLRSIPYQRRLLEARAAGICSTFRCVSRHSGECIHNPHCRICGGSHHASFCDAEQ